MLHADCDAVNIAPPQDRFMASGTEHGLGKGEDRQYRVAPFHSQRNYRAQEDIGGQYESKLV